MITMYVTEGLEICNHKRNHYQSIQHRVGLQCFSTLRIPRRSQLWWIVVLQFSLAIYNIGRYRKTSRPIDVTYGEMMTFITDVLREDTITNRCNGGWDYNIGYWHAFIRRHIHLIWCNRWLDVDICWRCAIREYLITIHWNN